MSQEELIDELIAEVKKTLSKTADSNPAWRFILGREALSASQVIERIDKDKKLRKAIVKHYAGLAVEIEKRGREKLFGEEK